MEKQRLENKISSALVWKGKEDPQNSSQEGCEIYDAGSILDIRKNAGPDASVMDNMMQAKWYLYSFDEINTANPRYLPVRDHAPVFIYGSEQEKVIDDVLDFFGSEVDTFYIEDGFLGEETPQIGSRDGQKKLGREDIAPLKETLLRKGTDRYSVVHFKIPNYPDLEYSCSIQQYVNDFEGDNLNEEYKKVFRKFKDKVPTSLEDCNGALELSFHCQNPVLEFNDWLKMISYFGERGNLSIGNPYLNLSNYFIHVDKREGGSAK